MSITMTTANREATYLVLVSNLVGVSEKVVGQAESAAQYLDTFTTYADAVAGTGATDLLIATYFSLLQQFSEPIATGKLWSGDVDAGSPLKSWPFSMMARSLMKLVLLGVWFDPTKPKDDGIIPTAASYTEGLVWLIGQAHPVGFSSMPYGHWANPPPNLIRLIGSSNDEL